MEWKCVGGGLGLRLGFGSYKHVNSDVCQSQLRNVLFNCVLQCWLVEINILKGNECFDIGFPRHVKNEENTRGRQSDLNLQICLCSTEEVEAALGNLITQDFCMIKLGC